MVQIPSDYDILAGFDGHLYGEPCLEEEMCVAWHEPIGEPPEEVLFIPNGEIKTGGLGVTSHDIHTMLASQPPGLHFEGFISEPSDIRNQQAGGVPVVQSVLSPTPSFFGGTRV